MSFQQLLDLLIYRNALKFRMEMPALGASLHFTEWWIHPKSARQALTAGKDATPLLMMVERPGNDLTPSWMELMTNFVRPAILSWFFPFICLSFLILSSVWTFKEAGGCREWQCHFFVIFHQHVDGSELEWGAEWGYRAEAKKVT